MRLRQKVLGGVVIAGVFVLILGLLGVFSPRRAEPGPETPVDAGGEEGQALQMEVVSKDFRATGKNWVLTAPLARIRGDEKAELTDPLLVVTGEQEGREVTVSARAKSGVFTQALAKRHVLMSDGVVVRYEGEHTAELRTERLEAEPDGERGWTDADVRVTLETNEGTHTLTGTGAQIDYAKQTARVLKNITLVLSGGEPLFPAQGEGGAKRAATAEKAPVKTTITAAGPVVADEVRRTVTIDDNVVIRQADNELTAQQVSMRFSEGSRAQKTAEGKERPALAGGRAIERFVADGDVRFRAGDGRGRCDRLTRDAADEQVLLRGQPAVLEQAGNRIEAERIDLAPQAGSVFVPTAGRLKLAVEGTKQKDIGPVNVAWERTMRLDRELHEAAFQGGVKFRSESQSIESDTLSIRFDESNKNIVEARADGHVRVTGRMDAFGPKKKPDAAKAADEVSARSEHMLYQPEKELVVFSGDTEITRGNQVVRGERVTLSQKDESVRVDGAGSMSGVQEEGEKKAPIKVAWGDDMHFSRATGKAEFSGGVSLEQGGRNLSAKRVVAVIDERNELRSLDAVGDAVVVEKAEDASGAGQDRRMSAHRLKAEMGDGNTLERFEARGNAVIEEKVKSSEGVAERRMEADHLTLRVNEKNELEGLLATGNAVIVDQGRTARGQYIEVTDAGRTIMMRGPGSLEGDDTSQEKPVKVKVVWVERMKYERDTGKAAFKKNVVLHHGERVMRADEVDAKLTEKELESLDARGNVILKDAERVARGERLVWDLKADLGSLRGQPAVLRRGTERLFGEVIEFAQKGGSIRIRSSRRVEGALETRQTPTLGGFLGIAGETSE